MTGLKLILSRMNGWALSLALHGGVALVAGLSVFSVQLSGGNGNGAGRSSGSGATVESYSATLHSGEEQTVSGTVLPDTAQYGRLDENALESVTEELPIPQVPLDIFAVGASEPPSATPVPPLLSDPLLSRPASGDGRTEKLPESTDDGSQDSEGATGSNGTGDGDSDGKGHGEGTGEGNAVGIFTPAPAYPGEARRRNIEGSVLVELAIAVDGSCAVRRVLESSGFSPLDDAVQSAVLRWKFRPADVEGRPENSTKRMRFTFRLGR